MTGQVIKIQQMHTNVTVEPLKIFNFNIVAPIMEKQVKCTVIILYIKTTYPTSAMITALLASSHISVMLSTFGGLKFSPSEPPPAFLLISSQTCHIGSLRTLEPPSFTLFNNAPLVGIHCQHLGSRQHIPGPPSGFQLCPSHPPLLPQSTFPSGAASHSKGFHSGPWK